MTNVCFSPPSQPAAVAWRSPQKTFRPQEIKKNGNILGNWRPRDIYTAGGGCFDVTAPDAAERSFTLFPKGRFRPRWVAGPPTDLGSPRRRWRA